MMGQYLDESSPQRDRWLLSYADLLTLLLAFFVVMYSVSAVDEKKLHQIASSIEAEMIGGVSDELIDIPEKVEPYEINIPNTELEKNTQDWMEFTLKSEFLFASGEAELRFDVSGTLNNLLLILNNTKGDIRVEGHTDNIPISTQKFPSNWELSAARAAAVVRYFEVGGIDSTRLSATGLSSSVPVSDNALSQGRQDNRRVVLKIRVLEGDLENLGSLDFEIEEANIKKEQTKSTEFDKPESADAKGIDLEGIDPDLLMQILNEIEADTEFPQNE